MENAYILKRDRTFYSSTSPPQQKMSTSISPAASKRKQTFFPWVFLLSWHRTSQTCNVPEEDKATAALTWKNVGAGGGVAGVLRSLVNNLGALYNKHNHSA